jgi:G3E family GTPase
MNPAAKIYRTRDAQIDMDKILHLGGFNLERALEVDPMFLEPEYPFEWGGVYDLKAGIHEIVFQDGPDPAMQLAVLPAPGTRMEDLETIQMSAVLAFSGDESKVEPGATLTPGDHLYQLLLPEGSKRFLLDIPADGAYAFFTEHHPEEFQMAVHGAGALAPLAHKAYKPDHEHDEAVTSVGIAIPGDLDRRKLNNWLGELLMKKGPDIFRMKGILSIAGEDCRFVFQGVHMLFDGRPDRPWGNEPRRNSMIFIGRNLNRTELNEGFIRCLA